jgi:hypothetical protein
MPTTAGSSKSSLRHRRHHRQQSRHGREESARGHAGVGDVTPHGGASGGGRGRHARALRHARSWRGGRIGAMCPRFISLRYDPLVVGRRRHERTAGPRHAERRHQPARAATSWASDPVRDEIGTGRRLGKADLQPRGRAHLPGGAVRRNGPDSLLVEGCVLFICQKQRWRKASALAEALR